MGGTGDARYRRRGTVFSEWEAVCVMQDVRKCALVRECVEGSERQCAAGFVGLRKRF